MEYERIQFLKLLGNAVVWSTKANLCFVWTMPFVAVYINHDPVPSILSRFHVVGEEYDNNHFESILIRLTSGILFTNCIYRVFPFLYFFCLLFFQAYFCYLQLLLRRPHSILQEFDTELLLLLRHYNKWQLVHGRIGNFTKGMIAAIMFIAQTTVVTILWLNIRGRGEIPTSINLPLRVGGIIIMVWISLLLSITSGVTKLSATLIRKWKAMTAKKRIIRKKVLALSTIGFKSGDVTGFLLTGMHLNTLLTRWWIIWLTRCSPFSKLFLSFVWCVLVNVILGL